MVINIITQCIVPISPTIDDHFSSHQNSTLCDVSYIFRFCYGTVLHFIPLCTFFPNIRVYNPFHVNFRYWFIYGFHVAVSSLLWPVMFPFHLLMLYFLFDQKIPEKNRTSLKPMLSRILTHDFSATPILPFVNGYEHVKKKTQMNQIYYSHLNTYPGNSDFLCYSKSC